MARELECVADPEHGAATWVYERVDFSALGVWTERRTGHGEDAEPTLMYNGALEHGLLGVYDGLGGAGGRPVGSTPDGRTVSHAFVASRLAHLIVRRWFADRAYRVPGDDLGTRLRHGFDAARPRARSRVGGNLTRDLPTTLALIEFGRGAHHGSELTAWWAGDSRCFLLTPDRGLQQISRDDAEIDDALEIMIADQPMTNLVSASGEFRIHRNGPIPLDRPSVLVCATDGFFNYVETPALFEFALLNEMQGVATAEEWARKLVLWVRERAADDASLALVALGFPDFAGLRQVFHERYQELYRRHWAPMNRFRRSAPDLPAQERREGLVEARRESWDEYRHGYAERMPPPDPAPRSRRSTRPAETDGGER